MNILNTSRLAACAILMFTLAGLGRSEAGEAGANLTIAQISVQSSPYLPIVILGKDLPAFINAPVSRISALSFRNNTLKSIPFQIDKRDAKGRYDLSNNASTQNQLLDKNDECVFMADDAGDRIERLPAHFSQQPVTEIGMVDPQTGIHKWVYLIKAKHDQTTTFVDQHHVSYDADKDSIKTPTYKIGFSKTHPFLMDSLQWHTDTPDKWTGNVADTMKIKHTGKLLGRPFVRTQADYRSRLIAVKEGPVRIIRRTLNTVHILGFLQSPSISIDYIAFANGFQMDNTIDLPFPLGWFFTNVKTYTTIDWNDNPSLPVTQIFQTSLSKGLTIDGKMTKEKELFNQTSGQQFGIQNGYGLILAQLDMEKSLPLIASNTLLDDHTQAEPPEKIPGQFGNIGFLTSNWEKVDTDPHHLLFNVLLLQKTTLAQGFKALEFFPKVK